MKLSTKAIFKSVATLIAFGSITTACSSSDDPLPTPTPTPPPTTEEEFTALSLYTKTDQTGDTWLTSDQIGVFMLSAEGAFPDGILSANKNNADNIRYSAMPDDNDASKTLFKVVNTSNTIYYPESGKVDIISYYPHGTKGTNAGQINTSYAYRIDITDQSTPSTIDVMYAKQTNIAPSEAGVDLKFEHKLSKITFNINAGNGLTTEEISNLETSNITFSGMPVTAELSLQDGHLAVGTEMIDFNPFKTTSEYDASFSAILIPQDGNVYSNRTVTFTVNNNAYTWDIPADEVLEAGEHYACPVTIRQNSITVGDRTAIAWNNTVPNPGTPDPIGIYTAEDLVAFSQQWNAAFSAPVPQIEKDKVLAAWSDNGRPDGVIRLRADIDMKNMTFQPINYFSSIFDGGNHIIRNLEMNNAESFSIGLFSIIDNQGEVRNIIMEDCNITGKHSIGFIAGLNYNKISGCKVISGKISAESQAGGIVGENWSSFAIEDCSVSGNFKIEGKRAIGGIAGYNTHASIINCKVNSGTILAEDCAGGIVGENNKSTIANCLANSTTVITSNRQAGGIVGRNFEGSISDCKTTSIIVTANFADAGGIVGRSRAESGTAIVSNCHMTLGIITAKELSSGGIAGVNENGTIIDCSMTSGKVTLTESQAAGGIAGSNYPESSIIKNCHVSGNAEIEAYSFAGGIVGNSWGTVTGCSTSSSSVKAITSNAGGIVGGGGHSISNCEVNSTTVIATKNAGGIAASIFGSNTIIANSKVISGRIEATSTASNGYAGGITAHMSGSKIIGCVASPDQVIGTRKGVIVGRNDNPSTIDGCYWSVLSGLNDVGLGDSGTNGGSFNKASVDASSGNFFISGNPTPIEVMNNALATEGSAWRWKPGNAASKWYPIAYLP